MIEIGNSGKTVKINIKGQYPVQNYSLNFEYDCPDEFYAKLVAHNLMEALRYRIESVRKQEYEAGWKDAKSKKEKRKWFFNSLTLQA